ncbi:MAG: SUMF1/EgtB/PvdO family nonheme iron enzyme [Desulfobacterales bacterium]|nr:SUMF1/EgtB/PvdO family nonheme iron enzyme [Desulfobacterales bacterium]
MKNQKLINKFSLCIFVLLILIMPILLMLSCDDGNNGKQNAEDEQGYISVGLVLLDEAGNPIEGGNTTRASSIDCSQTGLHKIQFLAYDEYGTGLAGTEEYCDIHKIRLNVAPGINRSLKVFGKDVNSKVIYKGEVYGINVNKGQYTPVFVELKSVSDNPVTKNPPVVIITSPVNMASFYEGENITFSANVTDIEDGALSGTSLIWSSDINGQIGFGNSFAISSLWVGSHKVTLTARDSSGLQSSASITIIINQKGNTVPIVKITSPADNSSFVEGSSIAFAGSATDAEDGTLTGNSLVWDSTINGRLGTGNNLSLNNLSVGTHTIYLTAYDSLGAQQSYSIKVTITQKSNSAPSVTINSPSNNSSFTQGTSISFSGSATDPEDGTLSGSSLVWTSSRDGQLGTGTSFSKSSLTVGTHTVTLTATDSSGASNSSSITVTISSSSPSLQDTITNSIGMTFVLIKSGKFTMGSPSSELGRDSDETQHEVTLTKSFYMQTTEVTQGQWKAVMGSNPSYFNSCGDNCPVEQVSWDDCQTFISKLNQKEGVNVYRLPTEAEWEYSARAGTTAAFVTGGINVTDCGYDLNLDTIGWYCNNSCVTYSGGYDCSSWGGQCSKCGSHPVGQKQANLWGLYDMHGNVREWCADWYGLYPSSAVIDPTGPTTGSDHVLRGGSWISYVQSCRSSDRFVYTPSYQISGIGLRLSRTP